MRSKEVSIKAEKVFIDLKTKLHLSERQQTLEERPNQ